MPRLPRWRKRRCGGLSLRQLTERAGLSRQAPYNHFADKEALLAELARAGFEILAAAVRQAGAEASGESAMEGVAMKDPRVEASVVTR